MSQPHSISYWICRQYLTGTTLSNLCPVPACGHGHGCLQHCGGWLHASCDSLFYQCWVYFSSQKSSLGNQCSPLASCRGGGATAGTLLWISRVVLAIRAPMKELELSLVLQVLLRVLHRWQGSLSVGRWDQMCWANAPKWCNKHGKSYHRDVPQLAYFLMVHSWRV